jgi:hypothetical protein
MPICIAPKSIALVLQIETWGQFLPSLLEKILRKKGGD